MSTLNLGDSALDRDHAELSELIDRFRAAPPASAVAALDALREHAGRHFSAEDADLRVMKEGNASCHIDEHAAVLKSLDEVREILAGEDAGLVAKARVVESLSMHLRDWLPEHVREMDAGVATFRARQRFGGAPVKFVRRSDPRR